MDALTCVQSPIIVQSHESKVRPGRILFPLLPLRIFGNTSADPSRCLADPLVAHEALLDLDMVASMNVGHLMWHGSVGSILARGGILFTRRHLGLRGGILARGCACAESANPNRGRSIQIMHPRVAPMVCKRLSNHSIFPKRVPLERTRTQPSSCWLFRSFIL